jgi:hypothetical protein
MGLNYRQQRSLAESVDHVLDPQTNKVHLSEDYRNIREKASTRVGYQIKAAGDANMDLPDDVIDYVINNIAMTEEVMSIEEAYDEAMRQLTEKPFGGSRPSRGPFGGGGGGGRPEVDPDISPGAVEPKRKYKQDPQFIRDLKRLIKKGWKKIRDIGEDILDFILRTGKSLDDWLNENIIDPILSVFFEDLPADPEKQRVMRTVLKIALSYIIGKWIRGGGGTPVTPMGPSNPPFGGG